MKYIDATVIHLIYRFISLYLHITFNFMIYILTPMQKKLKKRFLLREEHQTVNSKFPKFHKNSFVTIKRGSFFHVFSVKL